MPMGVGLRNMCGSTWISWKIYCCSWLATSAVATRPWKGCSLGHNGYRGLEPYPFLWTVNWILCGFGSWSGSGCLCQGFSAWYPWIPLRAFCTGESSCALSACLPGKLKAEFQVLGVWEGKPGVRQASTSGQSRGKARPTRQVLGDC